MSNEQGREKNNQSLTVTFVRALQDNYCYLLHDPASRDALVIDPSAAAPVRAALNRLGLKLRWIFNTHHHHDHVGGNLELKQEFGAEVFCSAHDFERVPGATRGLQDRECVDFVGHKIECFLIPGHTQGQIAYHLPAQHALFVGDTVFSMGCGRLLEGQPAQMLASLQRIQQLNPETMLFFGHEYTEKNAAFAISFEPQNTAITERLEATRQQLQRNGHAAAPSIKAEQAVNPFMRTHSPAIRASMGLEHASDLEVFTELRRRRDQF